MNNRFQPERSMRSIHIGGNAAGSIIVSGDGNAVNTQPSQTTCQAACSNDTPLKRKLLILAANPKRSTYLRLNEEVRDISEGLRRSRDRNHFEVVQRWAVRPRDFQRAMLTERPQMVHFSGHGGREERLPFASEEDDGLDGLYFEDEIGHPKKVSGEAIAHLFELFIQKVQIECVVLNGCYSHIQAEAIAQHVPYVVGMQQAIDDKAAIEFAVGFYDAIGNGESVDFAFESGKVAMGLSSTGYTEVPILLTHR